MKKIGFVLLVLLGGALAGLYYVWHQATKLPDWYQGNAEPSSIDIQQRTAQVEQKIQAQLQQNSRAKGLGSNDLNGSNLGSYNNAVSNAPDSLSSAGSEASNQAFDKRSSKDVEVQLDQQELNDVLVAKIAEKSQTKALPKSVKSVHTTVEQDTLKTGAVVDIKALKDSNLGAQEKRFLNEAAQKFPGLNDRKVYIGIEGKPYVQDGRMHFDDQTRVRVGNLSLSVAELAQRLGVSPEQVKERLKLELQLNQLNVKGIELQNGSAILRGSPTSP
ncbi:MAG: AsnC family protein [Myxacorys californica WJT36-NPBG1]|nr:AsnC family protein [Myxacorys californica WJT36-NPBG1]